MSALLTEAAIAEVRQWEQTRQARLEAWARYGEDYRAATATLIARYRPEYRRLLRDSRAALGVYGPYWRTYNRAACRARTRAVRLLIEFNQAEFDELMSERRAA